MIIHENGRLVIYREISASPRQLWEIITDTTQWSEWGPSVVQVDCVQQYISEGCSGRVKTVIGVWLPFAITKYKEPYYWSWRIGNVEATGHRLAKVADNRCHLAFDMPWWAVFYLPVCYIALRRIESLSNRADGSRDK